MITKEKILAAKRISVPKIRGVYFLINRDEIVYVGMSDHVHCRVQQHHCDKVFDSYTLIDCNDKTTDYVYKLEQHLIKQFNPPYNHQPIRRRKDNNSALVVAAFSNFNKHKYKRGYVLNRYLETAPYYCLADLKMIAKLLNYTDSWIEKQAQEICNDPKWVGRKVTLR